MVSINWVVEETYSVTRTKKGFNGNNLFSECKERKCFNIRFSTISEAEKSYLCLEMNKYLRTQLKSVLQVRCVLSGEMSLRSRISG